MNFHTCMLNKVTDFNVKPKSAIVKKVLFCAIALYGASPRLYILVKWRMYYVLCNCKIEFHDVLM